MSPLDAVIAASTSFGRAVLEIADDDWDRPTPCADWNVRALVAHVVVGDAATASIVRGEAGAAVDDVDASILGTDARAVWRGTALGMLNTLRDETDLERVGDHPAGQRSIAEIIGFRTWDLAVHAWDLHMALDRDFVIDSEVAEYVIAFAVPFADRIAESGQFGPGMVDPGPDASAGERLLALSGRGRT